ncbi:ATP-dependent protease la (LON) substrate-binding domain-containing protein [Trichoderma breve]|uniref:ATP-dependent protease la (LON) substrate-binding domain-containing protein n=1 Tax=Trichoderma breve TaxID=2034170 RepID=A0A9W9BEE1_9HYPO|nr:ATP-dependent protease la (LON) substrate-binding domain-containing protein [Trichoderma breve]KAJ4858388.1 ATP-dependent protease la (LON) substrate-binding domain-containing protein [Trichoderma breve]
MSSQTLVRNQVLSAIVGTLYKDQQVEHLRRQLAIFTREWNNLPIVMWRKMVAPNTTMQLDNFTTGTTGHLKSVRKTLQKAMQQPQRILGIILIMDNPHGKPSHARSPHDKVSQVGVLAHIRRAQWLGEDCRVVVDGISRFTYGNLVLSDGIMTTNTKPFLDTARVSIGLARPMYEIPPPSPNTLNQLTRLSVQDQLRYAYGFVSEMMVHPE